MVCLGYKAPDTIDPKFLDPKYAFEDIDASRGGLDGNEPDSSAKITSLKKLLSQNSSKVCVQVHFQPAICHLAFIRCSNSASY